MAQFLKCPDNVLFSKVVYSRVYFYILPELRPFLHDLESYELPELVYDDGEAVIQKILDKSNNKLRMYGTAKEIAENIKIFRNFTGSFRFFDDHAYAFNKTTSFHLMLAKILKSKILSTNGPVEFVKFDEKMFDEIEKEMREVDAKSHQQASARRNNLEKFFLNKNYAAIVSKLRELNPTVWDDGMANSLLRRLQSLSDTEIETKKEIVFGALIDSYIMKCIEQIVENQAPLFMSTPDTSPITVRLFEDGEKRYVMEAELYYAFNRLSTGSERFETGSDGFVHKGMSFEEVKSEFGDRIQKIEFIRTPILRSKHRAVPFRPHFPRQFVIPTVDYFFEFLRNLILGVKLFQKYQSPDWKNFAPIFQKVEHFFYSDQKHQYFLRFNATLDISQSINELKKYEVLPVKEVRNVKKNGFTVQNLKEELKYLGLTNTFSEIQDHAEDVYEGIDKVKKERYLRTCDLFDAVESCQLICVLNRVPNLKMFLHNQKGCGRVLGYKCEHCEKEKKATVALETMEISQQPVEVQKTSEHQNPAKKRKIETSNSSTPSQHSQPALSAPQICDKCSESSKSLENAENELKMSQDQQKKMVKELSDLKKENKKIVESEAKKIEKLSKEKDEEILKASKKIEELEKANLKLTAENQANERMIEKLLDRISYSSTNNQKTTEILPGI
ncbi:hypothetical protein GCK72_003939 [Caenorhabditis remanei]|uniref:DUF7809 domain-containing protein n=1 Tax=Caenorhabditis remanei TaxID=31234 RepID=A0A6A5HC68_CAERE|nr:hypothetical protein GCK72_003939 [Caenorhabditis remanei]KAF1763993.1 hypothetical protein GCK72_003939 [Caenorhabditis remanei]